MKKTFPKLSDEWFILILMSLVAVVPFWSQRAAVCISIGTILSAYYCFLNIFEKQYVGLFCSALYSFSTFRIYTLLVAGNLMLSVSFAFMPLALLGAYGLLFGKQHGDENGMLGKKGRLLRNLVRLLPGLAGTLLPWLVIGTQNSKEQVPLIQRKGLLYSHLAFQFFRDGQTPAGSGAGLYETLPLGVGFILILGLLVFFALWFGDSLQVGNRALILTTKVFAIVSVLLLFMSTDAFPWDYLSISHATTIGRIAGMLGEPQRLLGLATLLLVWVCGYCLRCFGEKDRWHLIVAGVVIICCIVTSAGFMTEYIAAKDWMQMTNDAGET